MDRLTNKELVPFVGDGYISIPDKERRKRIQLLANEAPLYKQIYGRLAEYENTGLMPDEIKAMQWISVKDRLPDEENDVLLLVQETESYGKRNEKKKRYYWVFTGWYIDDKWGTTYCHGSKYIDDENAEYPNCVCEVTHWMPLPEPPKGGLK